MPRSFFYYDPPGPGSSRPLAEPPMFDYDEFMKDIPSDRRLKRLFPNEPEWRYRVADVKIELDLLKTYRNYSSRARSLASGGPGRRDESQIAEQKFYKGLVDELNTDLSEMQKDGENEGLILTDAQRKGIITQLDRWEFDNLDDDGGTEELEEKLIRTPNYAEDVFMTDWDGEARKKYGHLAPPGYFEAIKVDAERYERERVARNAKAAERERLYDEGRFNGPFIRNMTPFREGSAGLPYAYVGPSAPLPDTNDENSQQNETGLPLPSEVETFSESPPSRTSSVPPTAPLQVQTQTVNMNNGSEAHPAAIHPHLSLGSPPQESSSRKRLSSTFRSHALAIMLKVMRSVASGFLFGLGIALAAIIWRYCCLAGLAKCPY